MTGCIIRVRWPDGEAEVETGYLAGYSLENVAAAAAACYAAGLPMPACVEGIAEVRSNRGRGQALSCLGSCWWTTHITPTRPRCARHWKT